MTKRLFELLITFIPLMAWGNGISNTRKVNQVDFSHVRINDKFWSLRLERHSSATLPVCIDQIEHQTGRLN
ncbi:MAG: glycoside hydrolase family 127 protein, partial [Bacteroidaceae bacterium]|nr:glycoside hydrolase family 127 protein [Bacteroidaceae bacterium]